ncbi:imidazoleglycerol-phosphate dehydratase HisB [Eubacteriales bacterium OttesenSCG-928-M02]|nr:imidazoleglycerol-phosphate dehydratase HisB [Eubacteriales bacterium OttesenSCG-928-M02]
MREATVERKTAETDVRVSINMDGTGQSQVNTGIGFFDHMLTALCKHGYLDATILCKGDLQVDGHHTVEDVGIVFGTAIKQAMGDRAGIVRYGTFFIPMDEALCMCSLDFSGRPFLVFDCEYQGNACGDFDVQLAEEFFRGVAFAAGLTLHLKVLYGKNDHHKIEGLFKAFARALDAASRLDDRVTGIPSTKGILA